MEKQTYILLISQIILFIIGLFIILFKSYFKKKGENIATKEDIGLITNEIEIIKNEISFKNQKQIDFFIERKKNLINFYDNYFLWTNRSINIIDYIISHANDKKILRELITELKSDQNKVFTYFTRIFLYDVNTEFTKALNEIYNETIKSHNLTLKFLLELENLSIKYERFIEKKITSSFEEDHLIKELEELKKNRELELENYLNSSIKLNKILEKNKLIIVQVLRKEIKAGYA